MAGKRRVPPQLKQHAFKSGSTKAVNAGAKGGRRSPGTGKTGSATTSSATTKKGAKKGSGGKRMKRS
jgi:hypothetical protein